MVNRFTPSAQAAISSAKKCADKMGHSYIGSEHLILGILSCDSVGKKLLEDKKIFYNDVYSRLSDIAGVGYHSERVSKEMTPKCKRVLEGASLCAKRFNSRLIGTEHLLYALCEEGDSVGGKILSSLGLNIQIFKNELATFLDSNNDEAKGDKGQISGAPTLSLHGKNLNYLAKIGKTDPLICREKELERLIQILSRRTKNNPCLIGEPGVGKTAIVEGLAQKIVKGEVPESLLGKTVVSLDLSSMIAGAKYRGEFEERMRNVMNEIKSSENIILFIDEIHTIIGAGAAEGAVDAANMIKPALARGQIQLIGATTIDEYRRHIEKDTALERRFQPITVSEPSESETINILSGLRERYEDFHGVNIPLSVIEEAVKLSVRYIPDRFLPDKAIDLIDEACSRLKMSSLKSKGKDNVKSQLDELMIAKEKAILNEDFDLATEIHEKEARLKLRVAKAKRERTNEKLPLTLTKESIEEIVTQWTSIPVSTLKGNEGKRLANLENELMNMVVGQREAISKVASIVKRGRAGLKNPKRPIGSFLLLGPTGVGKTELAKCIAKVVFASEGALIRLDMSEYMEKHSVSKLIGAPAGYIGYDDGGILTKAVRAHPYSVVLFDEIEKAHPDIYNLLLQILDEGSLTDSSGRNVSFKNTIIILTSNIGAKAIVSPTSLGFAQRTDENADYEKTKAKINDALKNEFQPELLNRLDEIIIFNRLGKKEREQIASLMLKDLKAIALDIGITIEFDTSVYEFLSQKGFDNQMGARPIRRAITSYIENPLSEKILLGEIKKGDNVFIICENDTILFKSALPTA